MPRREDKGKESGKKGVECKSQTASHAMWCPQDVVNKCLPSELLKEETFRLQH